MKNMRKNAIVGIFESQGLLKTELHFSEWWNGEGMDFDFSDGKNKFSLHAEEIHALVVAALASSMIDMEHVQEDVEAMAKDSEQRRLAIENIRKQYEGRN